MLSYRGSLAEFISVEQGVQLIGLEQGVGAQVQPILDALP